MLAHQLDQAGAALRRVARRDQRFDRPASCARRPPRPRGRDRHGRTISPWLIGMPPRICARYSPSPMRTMSSSISPKRAGRVHALGIGGELADRLDIGREPGEAVGGALLAVEQPVDRCGRRPLTRSRTAARRIRQQRLGHPGGFPGQGDELDPGFAAVRLGCSIGGLRQRSRGWRMHRHYACSCTNATLAADIRPTCRELRQHIATKLTISRFPDRIRPATSCSVRPSPLPIPCDSMPIAKRAMPPILRSIAPSGSSPSSRSAPGSSRSR